MDKRLKTEVAQVTGAHDVAWNRCQLPLCCTLHKRGWLRGPHICPPLPGHRWRVRGWRAGCCSFPCSLTLADPSAAAEGGGWGPEVGSCRREEGEQWSGLWSRQVFSYLYPGPQASLHQPQVKVEDSHMSRKQHLVPRCPRRAHSMVQWVSTAISSILRRHTEYGG